MSCNKTFSLEVTAPVVTCPESQVGELTVASDRSKVIELQLATSPHYCLHGDYTGVKGDYVLINAGDPGLTGALDTYLVALYKGSATAGTANNITDSTKNWTPNCFAGMQLYFTDGTGAGGSVTIASNTATTMAFTAPYGPGTDNTTKYAVLCNYDDDSGPGANSKIEFVLPTNGTYTFEGSTYTAGVTGPYEIDFDCTVLANFSNDPVYGSFTFDTFNFTDMTYGNPTSWDWDFGDGTPVVHDQNPSHIFPSTDMTYVPNVICGRRGVTLTAHKGVKSNSITIDVWVMPKIRIKSYNDTYFTLDASGAACGAGGDAWDGSLEPSLTAPCQWEARNVSVNGKAMDICLRRTDLTTEFCCVDGLGSKGFTLSFKCAGDWACCFTQYRIVSTSNNPVGVYALRTAPEGACGPGTGFMSAPATLEIEWVP